MCTSSRSLLPIPGLTSLFLNPANFRPYSYRKLVSLCFPIAQHISTIFIFLATFVRIRERLLDPRLLVWASIFAFALGYLAWQVVQVQLARKFRQVRKPTNRASHYHTHTHTPFLLRHSYLRRLAGRSKDR